MILAYLDTSAAMKLIIDERESPALIDHLAPNDDISLVASWLLHTELHCAAGRHPAAVSPDAVRTVLETVNLIDHARGDLIAAGMFAPLRSNDAIHLAAAVRVGVDELITYDRELATAASTAGLRVSSPH